MIQGGNATIFVSDMDRAVRFYTDTLGLKLRCRYGNDWAEIEAGNGLILGLHPASKEAAQPGQSGSIEIGFNVVEPLDNVVAALHGRGVRFRGPIKDDGGVRLAFFGDPDDNHLYLCEHKPY